MLKFVAAPLMIATLWASPALAQATPAPLSVELRAVLDAAIAGGKADEIETISRLLRQTAPQSVAEIDQVVSAFHARVAAAEAAQAAAAREANSGLLHGWSGEGQAGAFLTTGNSDTSGIAVGIALHKESDHWRHNFRALTDYQRTAGVTSRSQWLAAYEPNYKFNDRLYAFGLGQWERDRYQGYTRRVTAAGGLGYRVINTDTTVLDLKAGPAWRSTHYTSGLSDSRMSGLAGMRFSLKLSPTVSFGESADLLVDSANTSLMSLTSLDAKLGSELSARLSYQINRESSPPVGFDRTDTVSRISLVYGF